MKKRLLMLLSLFMAVTSVGWVHAQGATTGSITSEITTAQKDKPIVFGITTKKGNVADNTMVRVSLTADNNAFDGWDSYYYEPNGNDPGWKKWDPKNDAFGPKEGFPFQDATSFIQVIPETSGTFYYTLNVTKVNDEQPFITKKCTLIVENTPVSPIASIGGTDYASLTTAVHFAKKDTTIKLTVGNFSLASQLVINKPLTLLGVADNNGKPLTNLQADANAVWPTKPNSQDLDNSKTNLVSIEGTANGNVILKNISVMNSKASGINAQSKMTTNLVNVALDGNANAGLLVHSIVVADKLITIKNGWGGVNVGTDGSPVYSPKFTFSPDCSFAESSKIWSEDTKTDPDKLVEGPNGWISYVGVQGASNEEKRYWTNSKLTFENVANFYTDKTLSEGFTLIYANGNPITVEASGTDKVKISAGPDDVLEVATTKNPIIFGGAKFADVESSSITMKSGKVYMLVGGGYLGNVKNANVTVNGGNVTKYLVGGGYGPTQAFDAAKRQTADVTNASVKINKGAIVRYLISGGLMYAKTTATDVQITDAAIEYALGGGYAPVGISQSEQTDFATNVNTIGTAKFSMKKGTVKGAICLGGGYSYSYTKNMTATIDSVAITGGLYGIGWNGRSDKVKATITNSSFAKPESGYSTIASLVRGKADEISMEFNNCSFADLYECYLSADKDWQDGAYPTPVSGKTTITFVGENTPVVKVSEGMQDVTVIGAEVKVEKFLQKKANTFIDKFEVPSGKTWSFPKGMTIVNEVTLTNKGKLNLPASAIMAGITAGGTLSTDTTSAAVVTEMDKASDDNLTNKNFSIECKDGVIASNKVVAKELLKEGKAVMLLSFNEGAHSIASFQKTLAKITNLPDSVVYGTEPITLAFNLKGTKVEVSGATSGVVELKGDVLTIKKPGTVTFNLTVNGDDDATNTQTLKVTKRKVTLTAGLKATEKTYNGNKEITLEKESLAFSGKLGTDATGLDLASGFKGELTDANAGENKEVIVTATLNGDSIAFYELAPITFVKAKVTPKALTVKAENKERNYGEENPEFTEATTGWVEGDKLDGILKFTCSATKESLVKDDGYDIVPYGLTSNNYKITFEKGALTVKAVDPVIEMVEAKTVVNGINRDIQLKARLVNKGGVDADPTVKFKYGSDQSVDAVLNSDFYTGTISNASAGTFSITASATVSGKTGTSKSIDVTIDKKTPQVVSFGASVMPTMVYGNEMTLSATSNQAAATGKYTYSVAENNLATIVDGKLKATGVGKVTLTVTRATDATHSAAVATQTIEITPKPVTVTVDEIQKVYDGTTAINELPTFTLKGAADGVSVKTTDLKLSFASKNAGNSVKVLMPELTLTGTGATNYTLIQPENVTGKITEAPLSVTVKDVTRMWNQRYTKYEFEAAGLVNGETLSTAYSGEFKVTEKGSALELEMGTCPNYDITTYSGQLTINKGTPVAVVYGSNTEIEAMVVDSAGYGKEELTLNPPAKGKGFATISVGGQVFRSFNEITISTINTPKSIRMPQTKAAVDGDWNKEAFKEISYDESYKVNKIIDGNWTYQSTNANVLAVSTDNNNIVCTPVSTGKATILAINEGTGEVKILNLEVTPAELTISATDMDKTYDGTTLASGKLTLTGAEGKDVALDLSGITFHFADKNAGTKDKVITSSQPLVLIGSEANNYVLEGKLTGKISKKEVTVKTPLSAYYNGKTVMELTDYASNDRISGDIVPINVTFDAATVGEQKVTLAMGMSGDVDNYTLAGTDAQPTKGNILKSTIVATLPDGASSATNLKSNIKLTVRETGETVTSDAISFKPTIDTEGSGSSAVYYISGGDNDNYSVVYDKNQIGYKANTTPPDGGGDVEETVTISLNASSKVLPRTEEFELTATVSPAGKTVEWSSSDPTIATVTANGNKATVKGIKLGKATITAKIGDVTATCLVTVDFATGIEEMLAQTEVYSQQGNIIVNPVQPLQLTIVNMTGQTVYNDYISGSTQIPARSGVYIVKLSNAGNTIISKLIVR